METVRYIAKAIVGSGIAFVGAVVSGYSDGSMVAQEWWVAVLAGLTALGAVFGVRNHEREVPYKSSV